MKNYLSLFIILISFNSFCGGFRFPNVNYDHAKLYLMNIDIQGGPRYADQHVYNNGLYANTKLGNGILLNEEFLKTIQNLFKQGIDEILYGLGKCFIPRHGIIYYDKIGSPIASLTICFECDGIRTWSVHPYSEEKDPSELNEWDKAEKQMTDLKSLFIKNEQPVFDKEMNYISYISNNDDYSNEGEVFIQDNTLDSLYFKLYTVPEIKRWVHKASRLFSLKLSTEELESTEGDVTIHHELNDSRGTQFKFFSNTENSYLINAFINNSAIILPNGVSVGMSQNEVMDTFKLYDGLENPETIVLSDKNLKITYIFNRRTLSQIKLSFAGK